MQRVSFVFLSPFVLRCLFVDHFTCNASLADFSFLFLFFNKRAVLLLSFGLHCTHTHEQKKWKVNLISQFFFKTFFADKVHFTDSQGKCVIYSCKVWLFYPLAILDWI